MEGNKSICLEDLSLAVEVGAILLLPNLHVEVYYAGFVSCYL